MHRYNKHKIIFVSNPVDFTEIFNIFNLFKWIIITKNKYIVPINWKYIRYITILHSYYTIVHVLYLFIIIVIYDAGNVNKYSEQQYDNIVYS